MVFYHKPVVYNCFSDCSCFWGPWQFSGVKVLLQETPQLGFVWCFFHGETGVMWFWEEDTEAECHFCYIKCTYYEHRYFIVDADHDHLTEVMFVRILHCKVILFFPLFHYFLRKDIPVCILYLRSEEVLSTF